MAASADAEAEVDLADVPIDQLYITPEGWQAMRDGTLPPEQQEIMEVLVLCHGVMAADAGGAAAA